MAAKIDFLDWLVKDAPFPYNESAAKRYAAALDRLPEQFGVSLPAPLGDDACSEFDLVCAAVKKHADYDSLNQECRGEIGAALKAYRKYLLFCNMAAATEADRLFSPEWFHEAAKDENWSAFMQEAEALRVDFCARYAPEKIAGLLGRNLLTSLFISEEDNKGSLPYLLEFHARMRSIFGSIAGGSAYKFGLFYHRHKEVLGNRFIEKACYLDGRRSHKGSNCDPG